MTLQQAALEQAKISGYLHLQVQDQETVDAWMAYCDAERIPQLYILQSGGTGLIAFRLESAGVDTWPERDIAELDQEFKQFVGTLREGSELLSRWGSMVRDGVNGTTNVPMPIKSCRAIVKWLATYVRNHAKPDGQAAA